MINGQIEVAVGLSRVPIPLCVALKAIQIGSIKVFLNWLAAFLTAKSASIFLVKKEAISDIVKDHDSTSIDIRVNILVNAFFDTYRCHLNNLL